MKKGKEASESGGGCQKSHWGLRWERIHQEKFHVRSYHAGEHVVQKKTGGEEIGQRRTKGKKGGQEEAGGGTTNDHHREGKKTKKKKGTPG